MIKWPVVKFLCLVFFFPQACQHHGSNPKKEVVFQVGSVKVCRFELEQDLLRAIPAIKRKEPVPYDTAINNFFDAYVEKHFMIQHAIALGYDDDNVEDEVEAARRFFSIKNYLDTQKTKLRPGEIASVYHEIPRIVFDIDDRVFEKLENHIDAFTDPLNIKKDRLVSLFPEPLVLYEKEYHRQHETVGDFVHFYSHQILITPIKNGEDLYQEISAMARNQVMYDYVRQLGVHQADTLLIGLDMYRKRAILKRYLDKEIRRPVSSPGQKLRQFYLTRGVDYLQPERVSISLYCFADKQQALDAVPSIMGSGQDQNGLAGEKHSIHYNAKEYPEELKREAFRRPLGYVSYPIENKMDGSFLVFVKTKAIGERQPFYEEVADLVLADYAKEHWETKIEKRLDSLKEAYKVVVPLDRKSALEKFFAKYTSS